MDSMIDWTRLQAFLLCFICLIRDGPTLEITGLTVPRQAMLGKAVLLSCRYSLTGGDRLYSLSWLKDGYEFLRIRPGHPTLTYPAKGVHLKVEDATGSLILLWKTDIDSEGDYACEVTGEAPRFLTAVKEAPLSIVALPEMGPRIEGVKDQYQAGDDLNLTCISGPSYPPTNLTWYINGHKASGTTQVLEAEDGLKLSKTNLLLQVESKHLSSGGELQVRCLATISNLYWNSSQHWPVSNNHPSPATPSFLSHSSHNSSGAEFQKFTDLILILAVLTFHTSSLVNNMMVATG